VVRLSGWDMEAKAENAKEQMGSYVDYFKSENDINYSNYKGTLWVVSPDNARTPSFLYILSGPLHSSLD
jgi:hypothetical protein